MRSGWKLGSALVSAALCLVLVACSPGFMGTGGEAKGGAGHLRVVLPGEPQSLNPNLRVDDPAYAVACSVYSRLVALDVDYRVIPDLAQSWDVSSDGLVYTFRLAKNVRWHDGRPLTSADVKFTFEAIVAGKGVAQSTIARVSRVETPKPDTVVIRLSSPWAPFLPTIAWYGVFILPRHIYEGTDWAQNPANSAPIGSGPFRFVEWVKGQRIVLAANKTFHGRGPYLDQLTLLTPQNASSVGADLLVAGEVDHILARPPTARLASLQQTPGIIVKTSAHPARYYMAFNMARKPLDDVRVRRAINMAINRDAVRDKALLGYGAAAVGFYTPAVTWAYNSKARVPDFDPRGAARLLDDADLRPAADGQRLGLTLVTSATSPYTEIAAAVREQLQAIGVSIAVVAISSADYSKRVNEQRDFDLVLTNGNWGPDPDNLASRFGPASVVHPIGYNNPAFTAALEEGARRTVVKDRAEAYFRAQEILAEDLPLVPLVENVQLSIYRSGVTGLPYVEGRGLVAPFDFRLVRVAP